MVLRKLLLILLLFVSVLQYNDGGHILVLVSESGLQFAKDFVINKVISTTIPLHLQNIEKEVKIPLIGKVRMVLSNILINAVNVQSSSIETAKDGIFLSVSGATADLSTDWSYTYKASFFEVSDHGNAFVKVKGMNVKTTVTLIDDNGSLKIASSGSDCTVENIEIHINGGASWLYQGMVDAFQKTIISTVENTVSKKVLENMKKLDALLQSLPKERKIDDSAAMNFTFTGNPVLGNSSVEVEVNGLFMPKGDDVKVSEPRSSSSSFVRGSNRMVTLTIDQEVFNSATLVYFNAKVMHLAIGETNNGSVLSTSDWKLILPELYKYYPDHKMILNMSVTSSPTVKTTENGINSTIQLDIAIDVQDSGQVLPVARISTVIQTLNPQNNSKIFDLLKPRYLILCLQVMIVACFAEITKNNLTGSIKLNDFKATLKWSKIGELKSNYVEAATSKVLEGLFLPYVNTRLKRGFPLPISSDFMIKRVEIVYAKSGILVCVDIGSSTNHRFIV